MSNEIKFIRNKKIKSKTLNSIIRFTQTKDEILFGRKSFIEILLGLIKKAQIDFITNNLSNKSNNNNNNNISKSNKISKIKYILKELKECLLEIRGEKEKNIVIFQKQKYQRDLDLKKRIFKAVISKRSISNSNYIYSNYETVITEKNENYYDKEIPQLKLLNFKVENEIIKVENLFQRILFLIQYDKTPHLVRDHITEIIHEDKKNYESINQLLHQNLIQQREKFKKTVNMKSLQDMRINNIQSQHISYKNALKEIQKTYRYVNTQEIINEENKSYLETVNEDEIKNINNINKNNENNLNKLKNLELISINEVEKLLKLNMNINVNINYYDQYINNHFDKNKKYDNEQNNSSLNISKKENDNDSSYFNNQNKNNSENQNNNIDKNIKAEESLCK